MSDSNSKDVVTAIIITHNRIERLKRAINSVLEQSYIHIELIVVNDGSVDETKLFLDGLSSKPNIKIIHHEESKGACAARNSGIAAATGKYIAGLDDDDEWLPNRIDTFLSEYEKRYSFIYASDNVIRPSKTFSIIRTGVTNLNMILKKNIVGNQIFTETYKIRSISGFDVNLPAAQDWDVWIRMVEAFGEAKACRVVLQNIYQDENDRITTSPKKYKGYWMLYKKHKPLMDNSQRASHFTQLYIARNKKMSLKLAFTMLSNSAGLKDVIKALLSGE